LGRVPLWIHDRWKSGRLGVSKGVQGVLSVVAREVRGDGVKAVLGQVHMMTIVHVGKCKSEHQTIYI
jgi:hypothetical protein